ncbi:MAG TPA: PAS domain S-box protein [Anaerolineae bacterium]|nr:PAS domain S-box protein [Anaerolineae bacterium]
MGICRRWQTFLADISLRRKLVLAFLAVILLFGTSLVIFSNWAMRGALNLMVGADLHNLATAKALTVGNRLGRQVDILRVLSLNSVVRARLVEVNGKYRGDAAAIQMELADLDGQWIRGNADTPLIQAVLSDPAAAELQLFQRHSPNHSEVFLTDSYGGLVAATARTEDYYQADEAWWGQAAAQEAGGAYIDTLAWDLSSAALGVRIVIPIFDQEDTSRRLGMLVSIYRLESLYQLISVTAADQPGLETRLLLPDGQVLAGEGQAVTPLSPPDQRRLQAIKTPYTIQPFEGVERFVSLAPVATMADEAVISNLGWRVLVYQDRQAALAPLAAQQLINLGVTAAAIVVSALVSTWMAYALSRPVLHLTKTAQRIMAGDMSAVAPVTGGDEIGTLAATFNEMTARMREDLLTIQDSEARFRSYIEFAPNGIFVVDAQARHLMVNPAACRMTGYTEAELLHMTAWELTAPESQDEGRRFSRLLQEGHIAEEVIFLGQEGRRIPVLLEAVRLDSDRYLALCTDISERKQAELALQISSARLNDAQRIAHIGSWELDLTTGKLLWSDEVYRIFEVDPKTGDNSYATFSSIVHPDDLAKSDAIYAYALETHTPYEVTHRLRMADGRIKFVHAQGETLYDADGQPLRTIGVVQDITEHKQAEVERERLLQQLEESAWRIRQIMDTVPEGVLVLDAALRIQLCNPAAQIYLQTLAAPVAGERETLSQLGDHPITELLTSLAPGFWHTVIVNRRHFQVTARPIEIGPTPEEWVLVIRDVTEEYEAQQTLQRQERLAAIGQLAAGIAHDFNNILAGIVLYSQMSLRMPDLSPKLHERLTVIAEQSRRAADLITQILDFSRRAVLDRQPLDLTPLLKEQVKLWERTLPETIHITLTGGEADYTVNADPTRIQQVLMNLVVNARDAMPDGGHLRIGLARLQVSEARRAPLPELSAGEWVQVTVADTGAGIPDDVLPHIFEPFFTTKEPGKGTGLGLAQVYGIVKAHEGQIDVQTQLGAGTTFTLYLPALCLTETSSRRAQSADPPLGHGETILVVEDNATTRAAVREGLELLHYRTLEAENGAIALDIFTQWQAEIALVLTDMVMPEIGGKALAQVLHQIDPALPIVLMSGHPLEKEEEISSYPGVSAWIQKPPDLSQLAETLAAIMART